jgi:TonB-dependent receptor
LTNTFARPDYVDLAPIGTLSISAAPNPLGGTPLLSAINEIGNPRLRPTESRNWDVSVQYNFPGDVGWLALAGFHKSLDGVLFEATERRADVTFAGVRFDDYTAVTTTNSGDGHVRGLEISARYDLLGAPAPFDGFGVLVNAALIDSNISAPTLAEARPLEDQANALYSAQLYYERDRFQARLAYSYQGEAPRADRWSEQTENNYRAPWLRLDLKVVLDLDDDWRATFAGVNLTNTAYRTDRSTYPALVGSGPGYEIYGREYRLSLTRQW